MNTGKLLLICGAIFVGLGVFLLLGGRLPALGRLPGDFIFKKGNVTIYFPMTTGLLLSLFLSLLFRLARR